MGLTIWPCLKYNIFNNRKIYVYTYNMDYSKYTIQELHKICEKQGTYGCQSMNKFELLNTIDIDEITRSKLIIYNTYTKQDLVGICKTKGITGYTNKNKGELVEMCYRVINVNNNKNKKAVMLKKSDIEIFRRARPNTREIGGAMDFNKNNELEQFIAFMAPICRTEEGRKLSDDSCSIKKSDYEVAYHTHPKGNTPSVSDLTNSLKKDIHNKYKKSSHHRQISIIFTPSYVWIYKPSTELLNKIPKHKNERKEFYDQIKIKLESISKQRKNKKITFNQWINKVRNIGYDIENYKYDEINTEGINLDIIPIEP